jgi:hypothetical protein
MHRDHKKDAQIAEDVGLTAQPESQVPVTKQDGRGEEGIQTATTKKTPTRPPSPSRLDQLDRERADGEGMTAPTSTR